MAETRLNQLIQQIVSGTVRNHLNGFLVDRQTRQRSKRTLQFYTDELNGFCQYLDRVGAVQIDELSPDIIRKYLLELGARRNPGGIHAAYRAIKAFLMWYEFEFEPENWRNPIRKVIIPPHKIEPLPGVQINDVEKMVEACKGSLAIRDQAILQCLVDTGARRAEFVNLMMGDVDLITGAVEIRRGKGKKSRTVYMGSKCRRILRKYLKTRSMLRSDSPLFATDEENKFSFSGLREVIRRRAADAGIEEPGLHDFRRCFAIQMKRNGVDTVTISRMLGHTSLEVTKRYLKEDTTDFQEAHRRGSPVDHADL